ncbi:HK97 gp10 family phage protein [Psychrobacillus sp. NEAU-3TGS]|uniref:HK97 gp10 family phage protein n=1 Tax=Psychrobacillus sp. NEAU-3TGS TaxID=2995412 RepID=UPI0024967686|nr:HK97 gp10 family phage protein [Psychrobacillus sp. NEAU-3TGS]MDI2588049.1 HK97 gp10 family phage protein [Psychrobacillus sp. NEAU-3TGS]
MAKWGSADFRQLKRMQKKMEKLAQVDFEKFCEQAAKELAARLLSKVIRRTPVDDGVLRRGWTAATNADAQNSGKTNVTAYAESLSIRKTGNVYEVEIINPVNYASYVEFGHRTANHAGWVNGRFMLTISEQELEAQAPKILENKLTKFLGGVFGGD